MPHSSSTRPDLSHLLEQLRSFLRQGQLEEAEHLFSSFSADITGHQEFQILHDALVGARLFTAQASASQAAKVIEQKSQIEKLERELQFSMALMALLFFTGVWGFWRGVVAEPQQREEGGISRLPTTRAKHSVVIGKKRWRKKKSAKKTKLASQKLVSAQHSIVSKRSQVRSSPTISVLSVKSKVSKQRTQNQRVKIFQQKRKIRQKRRKKRKKRFSFLRTLRTLRNAQVHQIRRKRRRLHGTKRARLRFGDPALPSEVPPQWCGTTLRYGAYYPCLNRKGRRCVLRATKEKYGCLKIRR